MRGTVALPHGTGKSIRVVAITQGDNIAAAEGAGADFVGGEDLITKIADGWLEFDTVVATPDHDGAGRRQAGPYFRPTRYAAQPQVWHCGSQCC